MEAVVDPPSPFDTKLRLGGQDGDSWKTAVWEKEAWAVSCEFSVSHVGIDMSLFTVTVWRDFWAEKILHKIIPGFISVTSRGMALPEQVSTKNSTFIAIILLSNRLCVLLVCTMPSYTMQSQMSMNCHSFVCKMFHFGRMLPARPAGTLSMQNREETKHLAQIAAQRYWENIEETMVIHQNYIGWQDCLDFCPVPFVPSLLGLWAQVGFF